MLSLPDLVTEPALNTAGSRFLHADNGSPMKGSTMLAPPYNIWDLHSRDPGE